MVILSSIIWGTVSLWWLLACPILGLLYAWVFYRQQYYSNPKIKYLLGGLRACVVTIIALLLLSPSIKTVTKHPQKPLILIAQDNSSSIPLFKSKDFDASKFVRQLSELKNILSDDYDVREFHFDKTLNSKFSTTFNGKQTDISAALQGLSERFSNQNVGAVILATDGIYNKGNSPQYAARNLKTNIYTIALGDTIPKGDILIGNVNYNKTAFLGNDFEVEVLVEAYQSKGQNIRLNVSEDGNTISSQIIPVLSDDFQKVVSLKLHADKKGMQKFTFNMLPIANEISTSNNSESIYLEVLDNKQKILILYNSPHPDVSAIKASLESNSNYEVKTTMAGTMDIAQMSGYSLVVLYQLPASNATTSSTLQNQLISLKIPLWYIIGAQSDIQQFNRMQKTLQINATRNDIQEIFGTGKADFSAFTLSDSARQTFPTFPPLTAPLGTYKSSSDASVLLTQKIGRVETTYPLLIFGEEADTRIAVLSAEGIWKWRLAEFAAKGNHNAVDELLCQSVQYLTAKGDRSRFKVYPAKNIFDESEDIIFSGELYNDALELINAPDVKIDLKSKTGKTFSYLLTRNGQRYQLNTGALPPDEYTYQANAKLGNKTFTVNGQFAIKPIDIETRRSIPDHHLLHTLAVESGGQKVLPTQINDLAALIRKNEDIKTIVYSEEAYHDLVDEKWIFFCILVLLGAEWFLRKREGEI